MQFMLKVIKSFRINHTRQLSFVSFLEKPAKVATKFVHNEAKYFTFKSVWPNKSHNSVRHRVNALFKQSINYCSTSSKSDSSLTTLTPLDFQKAIKDAQITRSYILNEEGELRYSHEAVKELIPESDLRSLEFDHEAIFFCTGSRSSCLMAVFLWKINRGQGVGGVDFRPLSSMAELILDGNRFSKGLGIKSALAGMWAGGGKGFIVTPENKQFDLDFRTKAFLDFADFLTSLNGCMVAGVGIGSSVPDMDTMFSQTRYVSNINPNLGGSVNTSVYTGLGVVKAMEAAIEFLQMGSLEGKVVAIQGAGNVGQVIIGELLKKDVKHIYVTDCNNMTVDDVNDRFAQKADGRLTISKVSFEDTSIFRTRCDIFSPCARGKAFAWGPDGTSFREVLNDTTIPMLDTKIICGASNLPVNSEGDHLSLMEKKITYVTDVVPNRMGIVSKLLEPYGRMRDDPDLTKHLSKDWPHSIYQTTLRILRLAAEHKIHPEKAAHILGEELSMETHPLYPDRTHNIIQGLIKSGWHEGKDFWDARWSFIGDQLI